MKDFSKDKKLLSSYLEYDIELRRKGSMTGCILSFVLLPLGISLDYFSYPSVLYELFQIRFVASLLIFGIFLLHYTKVGKRNVNLLILLWTFSVQFGICYMMFITEKFESPYYAGLNLVILFVSILLPLKMSEVLFLCVSTVILYSLLSIDQFFNFSGSLFNNLFFLSLTSVISITSSHYNYKLRLKEFFLNYELEKKNAELSEINKIRTEFFANISHEFRTPLTLILGPIKNVIDDQKSKFSSFAKGNLDIAKENGFRLLKLVNDLLDIISLEEGKENLKIERININEFIKSRVDSMTHMANLKSIKLVKNVLSEEIFIRADENALDKILINLLNNAIKFTQKDGLVEVLMRINDDQIIIAVVDNGIGIKKENLGIIFDRFKQVDSSATREFQGTGLGLALVKELTQKQGGNIVVDSVYGKGTAFSLSFDIDTSDGTNDRKKDIINGQDDLSWIQKNINISTGVASDKDNIYENFDSTDNITCKDVRILIVDDEPDMLSFIAKTLNVNGYEVLIAKDGQEAINVAQKENPDVILLDLMLPNIDGLSVCKILKEDKNLEFTKIILLTARADEKSKIQALKNGADDFMVKPFSKDELLLRISNLSKVKKLQSIQSQDLVLSKDDLKKSLVDLREFQKKLIQSEKLNSIGTLSAGIIHEVNNPLSYAMMALRFLKADALVKDNDDLTEIVHDIESGMERINTIVGEFKNFVRLEEGGQKTDFLIFDIANSALKFTVLECKGVEVKNNIDPNIMVVGSHNHITQILINLITNACRAIEKSKNGNNGLVEIRSEIDGDRVKIIVKDNGIGMSKEELGKIFDTFYTNSEFGKGTGLGLSICSSMVQNHGGLLKVESDPGQGSVFSFDLQISQG